MIDGTKISIRGQDSKRILENPLFEWTGNFKRETGESKEQFKGNYHTLTLFATSTFTRISGSLHKFWNSYSGQGNQNHNLFTFADCLQAIQALCQALQVPADRVKIDSLECGINFPQSQFSPELIIQSALLFSHKPLTEWEARKGKTVELAEYGLKIYDKSRQSGVRGQKILRVEVFSRKMRFWESAGIHTLKDLELKEVWESGFKTYLANLSKITFGAIQREWERMGGLTDKETRFLKECGWVDTWKDLETTRKVRERAYKLEGEKSRLGLTSLQAVLHNEAGQIFQAIMQNPSISTGVLEGIPSIPTGVNPFEDFWENVNSHPLDDRVRIDQPGGGSAGPPLDCATCKDCGESIEGKRKDSRYCGLWCKRKWEANHKRVKRWRAKYGTIPGNLFRHLPAPPQTN